MIKLRNSIIQPVVSDIMESTSKIPIVKEVYTKSHDYLKYKTNLTRVATRVNKLSDKEVKVVDDSLIFDVMAVGCLVSNLTTAFAPKVRYTYLVSGIIPNHIIIGKKKICMGFGGADKEVNSFKYAVLYSSLDIKNILENKISDVIFKQIVTRKVELIDKNKKDIVKKEIEIIKTGKTVSPYDVEFKISEDSDKNILLDITYTKNKDVDNEDNQEDEKNDGDFVIRYVFDRNNEVFTLSLVGLNETKSQILGEEEKNIYDNLDDSGKELYDSLSPVQRNKFIELDEGDRTEYIKRYKKQQSIKDSESSKDIEKSEADVEEILKKDTESIIVPYLSLKDLEDDSSGERLQGEDLYNKIYSYVNMAIDFYSTDLKKKTTGSDKNDLLYILGKIDEQFNNSKKYITDEERSDFYQNVGFEEKLKLISIKKPKYEQTIEKDDDFKKDVENFLKSKVYSPSYSDVSDIGNLFHRMLGNGLISGQYGVVFVIKAIRILLRSPNLLDISKNITKVLLENIEEFMDKKDYGKAVVSAYTNFVEFVRERLNFSETVNAEKAGELVNAIDSSLTYIYNEILTGRIRFGGELSKSKITNDLSDRIEDIFAATFPSRGILPKNQQFEDSQIGSEEEEYSSEVEAVTTDVPAEAHNEEIIVKNEIKDTQEAIKKMFMKLLITIVDNKNLLNNKGNIIIPSYKNSKNEITILNKYLFFVVLGEYILNHKGPLTSELVNEIISGLSDRKYNVSKIKVDYINRFINTLVGVFANDENLGDNHKKFAFILLLNSFKADDFKDFIGSEIKYVSINSSKQKLDLAENSYFMSSLKLMSSVINGDLANIFQYPTLETNFLDIYNSECLSCVAIINYYSNLKEEATEFEKISSLMLKNGDLIDKKIIFMDSDEANSSGLSWVASIEYSGVDFKSGKKIIDKQGDVSKLRINENSKYQIVADILYDYFNKNEEIIKSKNISKRQSSGISDDIDIFESIISVVDSFLLEGMFIGSENDVSKDDTKVYEIEFMKKLMAYKYDIPGIAYWFKSILSYSVFKEIFNNVKNSSVEGKINKDVEDNFSKPVVEKEVKKNNSETKELTGKAKEKKEAKEQENTAKKEERDKAIEEAKKIFKAAPSCDLNIKQIGIIEDVKVKMRTKISITKEEQDIYDENIEIYEKYQDEVKKYEDKLTSFYDDMSENYKAYFNNFFENFIGTENVSKLKDTKTKGVKQAKKEEQEEIKKKVLSNPIQEKIISDMGDKFATKIKKAIENKVEEVLSYFSNSFKFDNIPTSYIEKYDKVMTSNVLKNIIPLTDKISSSDSSENIIIDSNTASAVVDLVVMSEPNVKKLSSVDFKPPVMPNSVLKLDMSDMEENINSQAYSSYIDSKDKILFDVAMLVLKDFDENGTNSINDVKQSVLTKVIKNSKKILSGLNKNIDSRKLLGGENYNKVITSFKNDMTKFKSILNENKQSFIDFFDDKKIAEITKKDFPLNQDGNLLYDGEATVRAYEEKFNKNKKFYDGIKSKIENQDNQVSLNLSEYNTLSDFLRKKIEEKEEEEFFLKNNRDYFNKLIKNKPTYIAMVQEGSLGKFSLKKSTDKEGVSTVNPFEEKFTLFQDMQEVLTDIIIFMSVDINENTIDKLRDKTEMGKNVRIVSKEFLNTILNKFLNLKTKTNASVVDIDYIVNTFIPEFESLRNSGRKKIDTMIKDKNIDMKKIDKEIAHATRRGNDSKSMRKNVITLTNRKNKIQEDINALNLLSVSAIDEIDKIMKPLKKVYPLLVKFIKSIKNREAIIQAVLDSNLEKSDTYYDTVIEILKSFKPQMEALIDVKFFKETGESANVKIDENGYFFDAILNMGKLTYKLLYPTAYNYIKDVKNIKDISSKIQGIQTDRNKLYTSNFGYDEKNHFNDFGKVVFSYLNAEENAAVDIDFNDEKVTISNGKTKGNIQSDWIDKGFYNFNEDGETKDSKDAENIKSIIDESIGLLQNKGILKIKTKGKGEDEKTEIEMIKDESKIKDFYLDSYGYVDTFKNPIKEYGGKVMGLVEFKGVGISSDTDGVTDTLTLTNSDLVFDILSALIIYKNTGTIYNYLVDKFQSDDNLLDGRFVGLLNDYMATLDNKKRNELIEQIKATKGDIVKAKALADLFDYSAISEVLEGMENKNTNSSDVKNISNNELIMKIMSMLKNSNGFELHQLLNDYEEQVKNMDISPVIDEIQKSLKLDAIDIIDKKHLIDIFSLIDFDKEKLAKLDKNLYEILIISNKELENHPIIMLIDILIEKKDFESIYSSLWYFYGIMSNIKGYDIFKKDFVTVYFKNLLDYLKDNCDAENSKLTKDEFEILCGVKNLFDNYYIMDDKSTKSKKETISNIFESSDTSEDDEDNDEVNKGNVKKAIKYEFLNGFKSYIITKMCEFLEVPYAGLIEYTYKDKSGRKLTKEIVSLYELFKNQNGSPVYAKLSSKNEEFKKIEFKEEGDLLVYSGLALSIIFESIDSKIENMKTANIDGFDGLSDEEKQKAISSASADDLYMILTQQTIQQGAFNSWDKFQRININKLFSDIEEYKAKQEEKNKAKESKKNADNEDKTTEISKGKEFKANFEKRMKILSDIIGYGVAECISNYPNYKKSGLEVVSIVEYSDSFTNGNSIDNRY